jgi:hypothetical protein
VRKRIKRFAGAVTLELDLALLAEQYEDEGCAVNGLFVACFAVSSFFLDPGDLIDPA